MSQKTLFNKQKKMTVLLKLQLKLQYELNTTNKWTLCHTLFSVLFAYSVCLFILLVPVEKKK